MTLTFYSFLFFLFLFILIIVNSKCNELHFQLLPSPNPGPTLAIVSGTHGNEPVGTETFKTWLPPYPKNGTIIIIPNANQCGLKLNTRIQPNLLHPDLNRNYSPKPKYQKSKKILSILTNADFILDFHEAWGFYHQTKNNKYSLKSLGSTLSPTPHQPAPEIASILTKTLNLEITDPIKKFTTLPNRSCEIPGTLACWANHNKKPYILIETSGQNNIQPMDIRILQIQKIIIMTMAKLTNL